MKKKLLLTAILSISVTFSPSFSEVLSDEELEDVNAQGFQQIIDRHEGDISFIDNNLDSVYVDENGQRDVNATYIVNQASASVNAHENLLNLSSGFDFDVSQTNEQEDNQNHVNYADSSDDAAYAVNVNKQRQVIDLGIDIDPDKDGTADNEDHISRITGGYDNNNNSVQLRDNAQRNADVTILVNASTSAVNAGINTVTAGDFGFSLDQNNVQSGYNFNNTAIGDGHALATNAEISDPSVLALATDPDVDLPDSSVPTQHVINHYNRKDPTTPGFDPNSPDFVNYIEDNNNNNNSVQSRDNVQMNASTDYLANVAKTAGNFGFNIASLGNVYAATVLNQINDQEASNHENQATTTGTNGVAIAGNFNKQTQVIDNMDAAGTIQLHNATGIIKEQDNNNNSVQKKDNSERYAEVITGHNAAAAAINSGLNVLDIDSLSNNSTVNQTNTQTSKNFNNTATGDYAYAENAELTKYKDVHGNELTPPIGRYDKPVMGPGQIIHNVHVTVLEQNNNNNSVQLADNAQGGSSSQPYTFFESINTSTSAMNTGMNVMAVGFSGDVFTDLFDEMETATGLVGGENITQINQQNADNHINIAEGSLLALAANKNKEIQWVDNCNCTDIASRTDFPGVSPQQNNNMNSVQIKDNAQRYAQGVFMSNSANSAVNASMNYLTTGQISGTTLVQTNTAVANNFNNTATAPGGSAIAGNFENVAW